jgi:hypothetical protein
MTHFSDLLKHFFTHKDFLPPAHEIAGTLFTPLHFGFAAGLLAVLVLLGLYLSRRNERTIRTCFAILWIVLVVWEIGKITWETCAGQDVWFEWGGILPLYPCSIFLYAMPLIIWGRGIVRDMGCGYVCSLGLLGGSINFVYPANILSNYSCISFAGFHTFFFHGAMVFTALVLLRSGMHSYRHIDRSWKLLVPAVPALGVSVIANLVNFSSIHSDYMFFRRDSFIFAPLGAALPEWGSVVMVYGCYLLIHALPYLPSYLSHRLHRATV